MRAAFIAPDVLAQGVEADLAASVQADVATARMLMERVRDRLTYALTHPSWALAQRAELAAALETLATDEARTGAIVVLAADVRTELDRVMSYLGPGFEPVTLPDGVSLADWALDEVDTEIDTPMEARR